MGFDVAARGVDYAKVVGALADAVKELGATAAAEGAADRVAATASIGTHNTVGLNSISRQLGAVHVAVARKPGGAFRARYVWRKATRSGRSKGVNAKKMR